MRLTEVKYCNFRGFEEEKFSLEKSLVLFVGDNARGKTSALKGISLALSSWVSAFPEIKALKYTADDVRKMANRDDSEIPTFNPCSKSYIQCTMFENNEKFCEWTRQYGSHSNSDKLKKKARECLKVIDKNSQKDLPYFGFYGTGRLWDDGKRFTERKGKAVGQDSRYIAYQDSLESSSTEKILRKWIDKLSHAEYVEQKKSSVLESVWNCLKIIVPGVNGVRWDPKIDDIVFSFNDGKILPLGNLSEGQRIVVSLVTDLCVRVSLLNPHLNGDAREKTSGVVLIDEIDLHLHPKWQKNLLPNLLELFPKIQFILTTHSPFIIQSLEGVRDSKIINLDDPDLSEDYSRQNHRSVEDIAENVMNVVMPQRSERYMEMKKAAKEYFDLLNQNDGTSQELQMVKKKFDDLIAKYGTDNPAYAAFLESKSEVAGIV